MNLSKSFLAESLTYPLILLVEDDEDNIFIVKEYLMLKGYELVIAHNGQEALEKITIQIPDIILMDIQMPKMDGLKTIELIRQNHQWQSIPIIATTALAMPGDKEKCLKQGANDYLSKPFRLKELVEKIDNFL